MRFNDIFARDVTRHMDPVIKSDDEEYLQSELEEYVLTPEVRKALQRFCDEYNDPRSAGNGAWISGFYGSGKSHLLKMLSHLLENREVAGRPALDYIKPKVGDDQFLLAALERACERTPSESILFNVGAKSDSDRRDTGESLLSAFIKVLNERCGYASGEQAYIALMERDLDREGLLGAFRQAVEEECGQPWEKARRVPTLRAAKIGRAYDRATGQPEGTSSSIVSHYASIYHPTPEDFATWVWEYIQGRSLEEPGFRLNFFVDEMGQYIADSVPLLQMLQDIAENLNTKCGRRAWLTVVSQEEMGQVTGRLEVSASGQFSKIQARFTVLIKIPANDANTVVRERLLEKRDDALPAIDRLHDAHAGSFKVLFDFPDGARHYALYDGIGDFEATYPLVPYQFTLFHEALVGLSEHEAFTGEYVSTGARNMLGTTRKVLVANRDGGSVERGDLIPFDQMYEGLRDELKSGVSDAISTAEGEFSGGELGVRILKALLLVKYVEGFSATPRNLRVLLTGGLLEDTEGLEREISDTLRGLEAETYVRRSGDAYEYLTDEEKDVEDEIKREPVTAGEISRQIGKLLREDVLDQTKVTYVNADFSCSFSYDLLVDGVASTQQKSELKVNVLTDLTDGDDAYKYAGPKELRVMLPRGTRLVSEVRLWLQTTRYVGRNLADGGGRRATILTEKRAANEDRHGEIVELLGSMLGDARWGTGLSDVTDKVRGQGAARMASAALAMVDDSYPLLKMLTAKADGSSVYKAATGGRLMPGESLPEYCNEALIAVKNICANAARCVVGGSAQNSLEARLAGGQHGWPANAVRQAVGVLAANDLVECLRNDEPLEGADLGKALSRGDHLDGVEVRPAQAASQAQVEGLRRAYREVSGMEPAAGDAKALADALAGELAKRRDEAAALQTAAARLPFAHELARIAAELGVCAAHRRDWLIENAGAEAQSMGDLVHAARDMATFVNGPQGKRYADARDFLARQRANIDAVPEAAEPRRQLEALLADPECYHNGTIPKINGLVRQVGAAVDAALQRGRESALADLEDFSVQFRAGDDYQAAPEGARRQADAIVAECEGRIRSCDQVLALRGMVARFKAKEASRLYTIVAPVPAPGPRPHDPSPAPPAPEVHTVPYEDVSVPKAYRNHALSTEADVDGFVDALRRDLMAHVDAGEKIIL